MGVANSLQMLKTVIMVFSLIKPHFSRRLSRLFFSASSRLSRIFHNRPAGLAQGTANMGVANSLHMLKTVIMDFSVIKPHFSRRLSRLFFSASSRLSHIFHDRPAGLAQISADGRLSRRLEGLKKFVMF